MQFYFLFQGRRSCGDQQADTLMACAEKPGGDIAQHGIAEDHGGEPRRATQASGAARGLATGLAREPATG